MWLRTNSDWRDEPVNTDEPVNSDKYGEIGTWVRGRVADSWWVRPSSVVLPILGVLAGTAATIFGTDTSKAFTNLGGGITIGVMGIFLLIGGLLALAGIARADRVLEVVGHGMIVVGAAIYASGAILGLGLGGIIAGLGYAAIATCLIGRIIPILSSSRK